MRKFLTIGTLALMMAGLLFFDFGQSWRLPFEPKVLAASGFILLTAYTMGEIVQKFGPPKLVGYIVTGVLFGPYLTPLIFGADTPSLFGKDVVDNLSLINALAQGLIGLTAGGELIARDLKPDLKNISVVLIMETLFVFLLVGGAIVLLSMLLPSSVPFMVDAATGEVAIVSAIAAALIFGALAVGTSPSTTLAVITETAAGGPLKRLTLGLVVAKDVSTVILFLICLPIAAAMLSPEGVSFTAEFAAEIGELLLHELGGAIVAGVVLGFLIWVYLRWIRAEMLLFVVGVVFVGMWFAHEVHIEALLMFIVAGFVVANKIPLALWSWVRGTLFRRPFSEERMAREESLDLGHMLIHELERLSLPVFVIFFTIAAAKLELAALSDFWIIALVYTVIRAIGMYAGTQLGVKVTQPDKVIKDKLWMGMFPQAGVTLTLAALAVGKIPWAEEFSTIIMATILVSIVGGPTLLKAALTQAGEVGEGGGGHGHAHEHEHDDGDGQGDGPAPGAGAAEELGKTPAEPLTARHADRLKLVKEYGRRKAQDLSASFTTPEFEDDALNDPLLRLRRRLLRIYANIERGFVREQHESLVHRFDNLQHVALNSLEQTLRELNTQVALQAAENDADALDVLHECPVYRDREKLKQLLRQGKARMVDRLHQAITDHLEDFGSSAQAENLLISVLEQVEAAVEFDDPFVEATQEDARFERQEGDALTVRVVKRLKRFGRAFGGFRTRVVDLFLLSGYFIKLPMPARLTRLANYIGGQERYVWLKTRILFRLADTIFLEALEYLDDAPMTAIERRATSAGAEGPDTSMDELERLQDPEQVIEAIESALRAEPLPHVTPRDEPSTIEKLATFFDKRIADLRTEGELIVQDMETYQDDLRYQTKQTLSQPFTELVEACAIAGTFELRQGRFKATRLFDENRRMRSKMVETARYWYEYNRGLTGRILVELQVDAAHGRLREVLAETLGDADAQLLSAMSYYPIELGERIEEVKVRLDATLVQGADPEAAQKAINKERALLLAFVNQTALGDMEEVRESRRFSTILGGLIDGIEALADDAPESIEVLAEDMMTRDEGSGLQEEVDLLSVPVRAMLKDVLEREVAVQLSDVELKLLNLIEHTSADLMELGHIIGFNLDAASSELSTPGGQDTPWPQSRVSGSESASRRLVAPDQMRTREGNLTEAGLRLPRDFAIGGLERALERVDHLVERVDAEGAAVKELIRTETVKQAREVREIVQDNTAVSIRSFLAQREVAARTAAVTRGGPQGLIGQVRAGLDKGWEVITRPFRKEVVSDLSRQFWLDRRQQPMDDMVDISTMLDVWNREDLPNIYRRLFSPTPNEVPEFFVTRPEVQARFSEAVDSWLRGNFAALAVVGEPGSGRSSFIDHILRSRLQGMPVYRRRLNHTIRDSGALVDEFSAIAGGRRNLDLESLKATIKSRKERSVVIIEESEHLFIRSVGGLDTVQEFLNLVTETGDKILWVLSMDRHAWDYLDMIINLGEHFSHPLRLRPMRPAELSEVILTRHRMSGYELHFNQPLTGWERVRAVFDRAVGNQEDEQALSRRAFFKKLHDQAGGNPMMGIFMWLSAVDQLDHEDTTLRVRPVEPLNLRFLDALEDDKLLVLANIILHNGLTVSEYSEIFRVDPDKAQAVLQYLYNLRLLHVVPGANNSYRLRQVLYQAVARHLMARNML